MRIVVTGIKGGVGKSAIAYSLAKEISNEKPVLILDMDSTLTISRMLGLKQGLRIENIGKLNIMPIGNKIDKENIFEKYYSRYIEEGYTVIVDTSNPLIQAFQLENTISSYYPNNESMFLLISFQVLYVINKTTEFLEKQISEMNDHLPIKYVLVVNMSTKNMKYPEKYNVIEIPFVRELLFKGIAVAPRYINIWNSLKKFL